MSCANNDSFTSLLPTWMPFLSRFGLIAGARTCDILSDRSGERGILIWLGKVRGKALSGYPLSLMFAVGLSSMAVINWRELFPLSPC